MLGRQVGHDHARGFGIEQLDVDPRLALGGNGALQVRELLLSRDDVHGAGQAQLEVSAQLRREGFHERQVGCGQRVDRLAGA